MTWHNPLRFHYLVPTCDPESFRAFNRRTTGIPCTPHPGSWGAVRKYHVHEGVDLYCEEGTCVRPVEPGIVVAVIPFTGTEGDSPWWNDTQAVLVEGASGVVVYGEIITSLKVGDPIVCGGTNDDTIIGVVRTVLKIDKGRPMSMLHLELHTRDARDAPAWLRGEEKPSTLRDPTEFLLEIAAAQPPSYTVHVL
jgi:hypothetical protein